MSKKSEHKPFALRLRELREVEGLSVQQLAERAGISRMTLWRLEAGRQQPSLEIAGKLAAALGRGLDCWEEL